MDAKNGKMRVNAGNAFIHPVTGQFIGPGHMYFEPAKEAGSKPENEAPVDKVGTTATVPTQSSGQEAGNDSPAPITVNKSEEVTTSDRNRSGRRSTKGDQG